jgi:putative transposase
VYDTRYHLVWAPTYRKWVLQGAMVGLLKAVSTKEIRENFPEVRTHRWGGECWEDGYFVRTVGDTVTAGVIKKYIRFDEAEKRGAEQLDLF